MRELLLFYGLLSLPVIGGMGYGIYLYLKSRRKHEQNHYGRVDFVREIMMTIESMIVFGLGVAFLVAVAIYADRHRAENKKEDKGKQRRTA